MSLPVQACSDQELQDYASIHPEAAAELALRIATGAAARDVEMDELRAQIRDIEDELSEVEDGRGALRRRASICIRTVTRLLEDHKANPALANAVRKALSQLEDGL
ncbi:hypothetical protein [Pseudomonas sp. AU12215]|uniref:hypothetical protein n=1 Tax=Pseudomonas sp. AU12215 TaxID=1860123 RepID=UPI0007EE8FF6|nr:hypothetical protein [Pseudomonas sp. AU12215]OBY57747.1 hypothetical protein A9513_005860 [Pseudomonas sp. AU12215]